MKDPDTKSHTATKCPSQDHFFLASPSSMGVCAAGYSTGLSPLCPPPHLARGFPGSPPHRPKTDRTPVGPDSSLPHLGATCCDCLYLVRRRRESLGQRGHVEDITLSPSRPTAGLTVVWEGVCTSPVLLGRG